MNKSLKELRRRTFLAALGVGVGVPLAAKMARLAGAAPAPRPTRLFVLYLPHGFPVEHFDPTTGSGDFNLMAKGIGGYRPLAPYQQQVTMVRGIGMADGATNHAAIRAALTGFSEGGSVDSIDYSIAKALGVTAHVFGALPYRKTEGFSVDSHLVKHGGAWVRAMESPVDAAQELFAGFKGTGGSVDESPFRTSTTALTAKQVDRLRAKVANLSRESDKLTIHLSALQGLGGGGTLVPGCTSKPPLPAVDATAGLDPLDEKNFAKILGGHLEASANALVCNAARVITLQCLWVNSNLLMNFPDGPGIALEHHVGLSHMGFPREQYARAQQWFVQQIADKFLAVLNRPDPADPTHTVLDNTLIYITTEVSDGGNHNSDAGPNTWLNGVQTYTYLPQLLIGGAGGYLKPGGRIVQVKDNRPHTDVLATLSEAMGVPLTAWGGKPVQVIQELKA